ncbi:hypothetical protein A6K76_00330 [Caryophanon latum]|uniref:Uncharacterized protein n=1 Tax=Caryophanon latum TaxID=33977 RepID=A0A1C0Z5K2_9BACL|nr:hypothetical protein A6K76_00330 [Caryophanon latum]
MNATSMWHHLHDKHRVRRRAPGIYLRRVTAGAHVFLSRVIAETKRAAIRELPVEWLINTLVIEYVKKMAFYLHLYVRIKIFFYGNHCDKAFH